MKIHILECGRVRIKQSQAVGVGHGLARRLRPVFDREWTDWLPIHAYAIESPEGVFVIDAGGNAGLMRLPQWHPYFRFAVRFDIDREQEIGPRLKVLGIGASDVRTLVLTHLHIDHDGGVGDLGGAEILVAPGELAAASGLRGQLAGYLPQRWPKNFDPQPLTFDGAPVDRFARSKRLTRDGAICVIPTPGHTPHHVSIVAETDRGRIIFTGDATYSEASFWAASIDGVAPDENQARATLAKLAKLAAARPTLILPAHDLTSAARLAAWEAAERRAA
jgi:glyoxylase-like metal-dependent hydrolase (beta-lactamase superfamily II)